MKFILFAILMAFVFVTGAFAQTMPKVKVLVTGGLSIPTTPDVFTDNWSLGFNVGGGVAVGLAENATFVGTVDVSYFSAREKARFAGDITNVYVSAGVRFHPNFDPNKSNIRSYVVGGGGLFRMEGNRDSEAAFGVHLGGGFEFNPAGSFGGFIEILYYIGFTEAEITGIVPIHVGLAFGIGH